MVLSALVHNGEIIEVVYIKYIAKTGMDYSCHALLTGNHVGFG